MQIKKYRARTLAEALDQVRSDLGEQALILDTKRLGEEGVGALLGRRAVEVTAARDSRPPLKGGLSRPPQKSTTTPERIRQTSRRSFVERAYEMNETEKPADEPEEPSLASMRDELRSVKANLDRLASAVKADEHDIANPILRLLQQRIRESGADADVAAAVVHALSLRIPPDDPGEPRRLRQAFSAVLEKYLRFSSHIGKPLRSSGDKPRSVIALVGPTGVGKTTTIAKLAANLKIHDHAAVGLLSVDTYRLAAIDQLRSFAVIADMPLQVAYTPHEAIAALQRLSSLDVVFVDTAGRSPRHREHLGQLSEFIRAMHPDEIHLAISATTKPSDLRLIAQQFLPTRYDHLIITKTDETKDLAALLNLHKLGDMPISNFTTGQNIPSDIVTADALQLGDWILSGAGL
jgi:flagellar biosynthesis protein FlhF